MLSQHDAVELVLWMAGLLAFVRLLPFILTVRQLYGLSARRTVFIQADANEVPPHVAPLLAAGGRELAPFGFEPLCCIRFHPMFSLNEGLRWALVCWHPERRTAAWATVSELPEPGWPLSYFFTTRFSNGDWLTTVNGVAWTMFGTGAHTILRDPYSPTLRGQWKAHQDSLAELSATREPVTRTVDELLEIEEDPIDRLVSSGEMVPDTQAERFRFTFIAAVRRTYRLRRGLGRFRAFVKERARFTPETPVELPVEAEVDAYPGSATRTRGLSFTNKAIVFVATLALTAITLPLIGIASFRHAVILLAVLIFHELGHWVAMKAFRYRDTSIFFLPFFGAATVGKNDDATPVQRVLVYLMGPAPGFIIGLGVLAVMWNDPARSGSWVFETAIFLAVLNAMNLLPILPLDGGHIVNLLVFSRHPWAEAAFRIVTIIGLTVACIALHFPPIIVLPIFLALSVRVLFMRARLAQALRKEPAGDERARVRRGFQWLRDRGYGSLPFARRAAIVRLALAEPPAFSSATAAGGLLVLYLGIVALAPVAYVKLYRPRVSDAASWSPDNRASHRSGGPNMANRAERR